MRNRLATDDVELVEECDEPDYVSVKCRDPDGYIVKAWWEPERRKDPPFRRRVTRLGASEFGVSLYEIDLRPSRSGC